MKQILTIENCNLLFINKTIYIQIFEKCNSFKQLDYIIRVLEEELELRDIDIISFDSLTLFVKEKHLNEYVVIVEKTKIKKLMELHEAILYTYIIFLHEYIDS